MENFIDLLLIFLTPLLVIAVFALLLTIFKSQFPQPAKPSVPMLALVYVALTGVTALIIFQPGSDVNLIERYGVTENELKKIVSDHEDLAHLLKKYDYTLAQLERAARQHRKLAPSFKLLNNDISKIEDAVRIHREKLDLYLRVQGGWCFYSEFNTPTGADTTRGEMAIEFDHINQQMMVMGALDTFNFRSNRILLDPYGLQYDWIANNTDGPARDAAGTTYLTFDKEDERTRLKRVMRGFYFVKGEDGTDRRGNLWLVRRGQTFRNNDSPILESCNGVLLAELGDQIDWGGSTSAGRPTE